jgi:hypothetical protein
MRTSALLTLVLALAACQPASEPADSAPPPEVRGETPTSTPSPAAPTGPVELRTDRTSYAPGGQVGLTIVNGGTAGYSFNPCTRAVQREVNGAWEPVPEPDRVCTMEAWLLEPGATRTATTELPASLAEGRYRLAISLSPGSQPAPATPVIATSAPFTVGR